MPKKSMIKEYFNHLKEYVKIYGEKTILLWQCGSFYEVYGLKDKDGLADDGGDVSGCSLPLTGVFLWSV